MAAIPANIAPASLSGVARALVQNGKLAARDAEQVTDQAKSAKVTFLEQLIASKKMSGREVATFAAETFGYPLFDLGAMDEGQIPATAIDRKIIQNFRVIPLAKRGNRISVATADPTNPQAVEQIKFSTQLAVDFVVVDEERLAPLIAKLGESANDTLMKLSDEDINLEFTDEETAAAASEDPQAVDVDDAPVVKFLQKILIDAINDGASDLHFEPFE